LAQRQAYDLAIVGAGPTGATLAIALGKTRPDLRVCLVDRLLFPRDKVCGDALGPEVIKQLTALGETSIIAQAEPVEEVELLSPDRRSAVLRVDVADLEFPYGVVIRRLVFDAALLNTARQYCDVYEGLKVTGITFSSGGATLVGNAAGRESHINARFVIGADGAYSTVRKSAGFPKPRQFSLGVAIRGYARAGVGIQRNRLVLAYLREILPGYGWVFPVTDGTVNVGIGVTQRDLRHQSVDLRATLTTFVEYLCDKGVLESPVIDDVRSHRLTHAFPLLNPYRKNVLVLGDAAGMMNSLSGEGIAYGMGAAVALAAALRDAKSQNAPDETAFVHFVKAFRRQHRAHYVSNFLALQAMRHERFASRAIDAATSDSRVLADAIRLMFGNGRLTLRSSRIIAASILRSKRISP